MPEFPGGEQALRTYIGKEIKYPDDAVKAGIKGKVNVTFVIDKDGKCDESQNRQRRKHQVSTKKRSGLLAVCPNGSLVKRKAKMWRLCTHYQSVLH